MLFRSLPFLPLTPNPIYETKPLFGLGPSPAPQPPGLLPRPPKRDRWYAPSCPEAEPFDQGTGAGRGRDPCAYPALFVPFQNVEQQGPLR